MTGNLSYSEPLDVIVAIGQPVPLATGNTTNLNSIIQDINGVVWAIDSNGDARQLSVTPSNVIPIADNEADAAIRTGIAGISLLYSRADHNHPIRRQAIPTQPVITVNGTGLVLINTFLNGTVSDEESVTFYMTIQVSQTISNAWNYFIIPNIAGFQRAEIYNTGSYRITGVPNTGYAPANSMNMEWSVYFNGTCYLNLPNRTQATQYYLSFAVKYTRS